MEMKTKMYGIDVSHWQGTIDFEKVAKTGIKFVMIKAGGFENNKLYTDDEFGVNYKNAVKAGLHVGAYIYVGETCDTDFDIKTLAYYFINIFKKYRFDMPIAIDVEEYMTDSIVVNSNLISSLCLMFEKEGYYTVIYGSEKSTFDGIISAYHTGSHDRWVAKYSHKPPKLYCGMWQFSSEHKIDGINGNVDVNVSFKDYPSIIKKMKERTN